jgi:hypothetical protein
MTVTAFTGPTISFGTVLTSTSGDGITGQDYEHNEQRAPQFSDLGDALMDPRSAYMYQPGSGPSVRTFGFYNNTGLVDYVPSAINSSAFVVNTGSSGVSTFTLTSGISSNGTFATTIIAPETGKATGTLIAVDSTAAFLTFGSAGTFVTWNPSAGTGRNITIKPSSNLDGGTYTIAGRDMYGYKMTETIAGGSTNLAGKKAFKYVSSITNASAPTSTGVLVGFGDIYGFPLAVPYAGLNIQVGLNSSANNSAVVALSTTTIVLASTVATQTSTTPDVRGTYASSVASNGVQRLQLLVTPAASAAAAITSTNFAPFFGGVQFSSV